MKDTRPVTISTWQIRRDYLIPFEEAWLTQGDKKLHAWVPALATDAEKEVELALRTTSIQYGEVT